MPTPPDGTRRPMGAWIGAGLWLGLALALGRGTVILAMDHAIRGLDLAITSWRIAERLPWTAAWALSTGLAAAYLLARPGAPARQRALSVLGSALLFLAVLSGWPFDDAYHVPGVGSERGRGALAVLALAALALALGAAWIARARVRLHLGSRPSVATALLLAIGLPIVARVLESRPGEVMTVREVLRDLVLDERAWIVETSHPAAPPVAGALTPALDYKVDGGEMPALLLAPPARVRFRLDGEHGPLRFVAAAGCDVSLAEGCAAERDAPAIVFRIAVGGRVVLEHRRTPWRGEPESARAWARLGGGAGLELQPGSEVVLETLLERAPGSAGAAAPLAVGFGGLSLHRRSERARERATSDRPNIVLVVMDTLRADRTTVDDPALSTTPHLARLAARGIAYEQAFATSSWTWPSTASILTGLDPAAHGVVSDRACHLSDELETLAEVLQRAGATTAAFSCNPLVARTRNFDQGFELFDDAPDVFRTSDQVLPDVLRWIDAHAALRFFLYLHLVDPHELHRARPEDLARFAGPRPSGLPEHAMTEYATRLLDGGGRTPDGGWDPARVVPADHALWLRQAYDAAVAGGDRALGAVLARLEGLGLSERTLIAFTSDHGEEFLEHGHLKHGHALHAELVRVPLVLAGPGVARGERVSAAVSNADLAPTLARAGGAALALPGASDLCRASGHAPRAIHTATEQGWWAGENRLALRGVRADGWSLHCVFDPIGLAPADRPAPGRLRLFDLRTDPGELADRAAPELDLATELERRIAIREAELAARRPRVLRAGRGTLEMLRATGYAGDGR